MRADGASGHKGPQGSQGRFFIPPPPPPLPGRRPLSDYPPRKIDSGTSGNSRAPFGSSEGKKPASAISFLENFVLERNYPPSIEGQNQRRIDTGIIDQAYNEIERIVKIESNEEQVLLRLEGVLKVAKMMAEWGFNAQAVVAGMLYRARAIDSKSEQLKTDYSAILNKPNLIAATILREYIRDLAKLKKMPLCFSQGTRQGELLAEVAIEYCSHLEPFFIMIADVIVSLRNSENMEPARRKNLAVWARQVGLFFMKRFVNDDDPTAYMYAKRELKNLAMMVLNSAQHRTAQDLFEALTGLPEEALLVEMQEIHSGCIEKIKAKQILLYSSSYRLKDFERLAEKGRKAENSVQVTGKENKIRDPRGSRFVLETVVPQPQDASLSVAEQEQKLRLQIIDSLHVAEDAIIEVLTEKGYSLYRRKSYVQGDTQRDGFLGKKDNGYESIHLIFSKIITTKDAAGRETTVEVFYEVQIRDQKMHYQSVFGEAAHGAIYSQEKGARAFCPFLEIQDQYLRFETYRRKQAPLPDTGEHVLPLGVFGVPNKEFIYYIYISKPDEGVAKPLLLSIPLKGCTWMDAALNAYPYLAGKEFKVLYRPFGSEVFREVCIREEIKERNGGVMQVKVINAPQDRETVNRILSEQSAWGRLPITEIVLGLARYNIKARLPSDKTPEELAQDGSVLMHEAKRALFQTEARKTKRFFKEFVCRQIIMLLKEEARDIINVAAERKERSHQHGAESIMGLPPLQVSERTRDLWSRLINKTRDALPGKNETPDILRAAFMVNQFELSEEQIRTAFDPADQPTLENRTLAAFSDITDKLLRDFSIKESFLSVNRRPLSKWTLEMFKISYALVEEAQRGNLSNFFSAWLQNHRILSFKRKAAESDPNILTEGLREERVLDLAGGYFYFVLAPDYPGIAAPLFPQAEKGLLLLEMRAMGLPEQIRQLVSLPSGVPYPRKSMLFLYRLIKPTGDDLFSLREKALLGAQPEIESLLVGPITVDPDQNSSSVSVMEIKQKLQNTRQLVALLDKLNAFPIRNLEIRRSKKKGTISVQLCIEVPSSFSSGQLPSQVKDALRQSRGENKKEGKNHNAGKQKAARKKGRRKS